MTLPTAKDLMSSHVLAARADWSLQQLASFFTEHAISGAPVLSENGALVGVVSLSDVARHTGSEATEDAPPAFYQHETAHLHVPPGTLDDLAAPSGTTVRDIMMPTLFCVEEDAPADEIADKMMRSGLHRLLVVRSGSRRDVVGIVTTLDMLQIIRDLATT